MSDNSLQAVNTQPKRQYVGCRALCWLFGHVSVFECDADCAKIGEDRVAANDVLLFEKSDSPIQRAFAEFGFLEETVSSERAVEVLEDVHDIAGARGQVDAVSIGLVYGHCLVSRCGVVGGVGSPGR